MNDMHTEDNKARYAAAAPVCKDTIARIAQFNNAKRVRNQYEGDSAAFLAALKAGKTPHGATLTDWRNRIPADRLSQTNGIV